VTGYGYTGPYSSRPGYDFIVQAMGGFMSITGPKEGDPHRAGVAIADISAGMFAASAVLAALYARERTGEGQRIDMALLDSQIALLTYAASNYFVSGETPARHGNAHPNIVPYQSFTARDGQFAFAAGNDSQWEKFCGAVDRPQWLHDERFRTNSARVQNRDLVAAALDDLFVTRDAAHWLALCEQIGLPAGPLNSIDRVFEDAQVPAREMRVTAQHSEDGDVPLLNSPLRIPTAPTSIRRAPPTLGEHTEEVLAEMFGLDAASVAALRQEGVV
ncbi:MAG TPA: CaiB/BaiF CoA-transferase family protein, partial [Anaerolineales bacterium]|nr:CaiB/BaiF CoA-transferase family protein [Anaerolineales bacterium]